MSNTANESADKIRYRVEKISKDLETPRAASPATR